jgi:phosphatidylglycerol:prolipoprotein diacylglycerol transferase
MLIDQIGIHIGPVYIRFYGLILMTGAFLGGWLAAREAKRRGHNPELVWDGLIWALIGGIIGARLWHIFTPSPSQVEAGLDTAYYLNLTNLVTVFTAGTTEIKLPAALAVGNGGLGIPGAVIGGLIGLYFYVRRNKLVFIEWLDIVAPAVALGQAVGRWGNFVNQELYGAPTTLPWGLNIEAAYRLPGFTDPALRFHPLFLYESIGTALICAGLVYISRRYADKLRLGDLFWLYCIAYPALRFFLDFIRLDNAKVLGLNANQSFMLIVIVVAIFMLVNGHRKPRRHELKTQTEAVPVTSTSSDSEPAPDQTS